MINQMSRTSLIQKKKKKNNSNPKELIVAIFEDTKQKYDATVKSVRTALVKSYSMFQIGLHFLF